MLKNSGTWSVFFCIGIQICKLLTLFHDLKSLCLHVGWDWKGIFHSHANISVQYMWCLLKHLIPYIMPVESTVSNKDVKLLWHEQNQNLSWVFVNTIWFWYSYTVWKQLHFYNVVAMILIKQSELTTTNTNWESWAKKKKKKIFGGGPLVLIISTLFLFMCN